MKKEFKSKSEKETRNLAKLFAQEILRTEPAKRALVIAFVGELGTGKTTFIQSLIRSLGARQRVTSPTFIFFRRFLLPQTKRFRNIFHVDAYRIKSPKELGALKLKEILADPQNIVLVEWALKAKSAFPKGTIWIELKHGQKPNERHLTFN